MPTAYEMLEAGTASLSMKMCWPGAFIVGGPIVLAP